MKLTSHSKDIQLYPLLNKRFLKVKEDSLVNIVLKLYASQELKVRTLNGVSLISMEADPITSPCN